MGWQLPWCCCGEALEAEVMFVVSNGSGWHVHELAQVVFVHTCCFVPNVRFDLQAIEAVATINNSSWNIALDNNGQGILTLILLAII